MSVYTAPLRSMLQIQTTIHSSHLISAHCFCRSASTLSRSWAVASWHQRRNSPQCTAAAQPMYSLSPSAMSLHSCTLSPSVHLHESVRCMANREQRSKDKSNMKKKKEKQSASSAKAMNSASDLPPRIHSLLTDARLKMSSHVSQLTTDLLPISSSASGRLDPSVIENIRLPRLSQSIGDISTVSMSSSQQLTIQAYDEDSLGDMHTALQDKSLDFMKLTLTVDESTLMIKIDFPKLSNEMRTSILKKIKKHCEHAKTQIRAVRSHALIQIQKTPKDELDSNDAQTAKTTLQRLTDEHTEQVNKQEKAKEHELRQ